MSDIKRFIGFTLIVVFALGLSACSGQKDELMSSVEIPYENLTSVDVQKVDQEGNYEEDVMITEREKIDVLKSSFEKVKWEPNREAEMSREPDLLVTLFFTLDENMPERLYEYRIWFNMGGTAEVISNHVKEGYGTLNEEDAQQLKSNLLN